MITTLDRSIRIVAVLAFLAGLLALVAWQPEAASAQTSAFCEQYPQDPDCQGGGGTVGGGTSDTPGSVDASGSGPGSIASGASGDAGGGELPFTGYPLSTLVLLLLILLAIGLTIRAYLALRDRARAGGSAPPNFG